ncbi:MAG: DUF2332 domain-containing protein [Frankiaceae bacterium]|nr:DUF2332 domain-containing protein [Frankiaceae bacterium]MBV9872551.1 DUF2332 domain-containing protein [Frankiaceae bacterium]
MQAEQARTKAPRYAAICESFATDERIAALIEDPPRWDAPLRVMSALHYLVLAGRASWDDIDTALVEHADFLRRHIAQQGVQTNEVQRCWSLLPCFLEVAHRTGAAVFDVIELGSSAGLNLGWDSYRYEYAAGTWGPADATVAFTGEERRPVPAHLLTLAPVVRTRTGVDLNPIDLTTDHGIHLLKSFIWVGQDDRLARLDRAIGALRDNPPEMIAGDLADVLPVLLANRATDALTVVWQTAVLGYLPEQRRELVLQTLAEAGAVGPLAFISTSSANDGSHLYYGLTIQLWPSGERVQVAHADWHGAFIDWLPADQRTADDAVIAF